MNPAPGHVFHATKQITCGGSDKNQHKVVMPSFMYLQSTNNSAQADDNTVVTENCSSSKMRTTYGLLDSGTTNHFLALESVCTNKHKTTKAINITIPNGSQISSTHECKINWPNITCSSRNAHIVPALHDKDLISVVKLCNHGCNIVFAICVAWYSTKDT